MKTAQTYRIWHWAGLGMVGLAGCAGPGFEPPFSDDSSNPTAAAADPGRQFGQEGARGAPPSSPNGPGAGAPVAGAPESTGAAMPVGAAPQAVPPPMPGSDGSGVMATMGTQPPMDAMDAMDAPLAGAMGDGEASQDADEDDASLLGADAGMGEAADTDCDDVPLQPPNGCSVTLDWPLEMLLPGSLSLVVQGAGEDGLLVQVNHVMAVADCDGGQGFYWSVEPGKDEPPSLVLCPASCALTTDGAALSSELDCSTPTESPAGGP